MKLEVNLLIHNADLQLFSKVLDSSGRHVLSFWPSSTGSQVVRNWEKSLGLQTPDSRHRPQNHLSGTDEYLDVQTPSQSLRAWNLADCILTGTSMIAHV